MASTLTTQSATIFVQGVTMQATQATFSNIQVIHNPWSETCQKRLPGEPFDPHANCEACDPPIYARPGQRWPVCMYCWKPLTKFEPLANYKGPESEWTHVIWEKSNGRRLLKVTCQTKQSGPRVPRPIPGRLIIYELELALETALARNTD